VVQRVEKTPGSLASDCGSGHGVDRAKALDGVGHENLLRAHQPVQLERDLAYLHTVLPRQLEHSGARDARQAFRLMRRQQPVALMDRIVGQAHDRLGAEMADGLTRRLRTATRVREIVVMCVAEHLQLGFLIHRQPLTLRQIDAYLRRTGAAPVEMILLSVADRLATRGPRSHEIQITRHLELARAVMHAHLELRAREPITSPVPGDVLAARFDRPPGPWLGEVMAEIRAAQLAGAISERRAIRIAEQWVRAHPDAVPPG